MKIFVVGGAVRDVLLGLTPKDIDYVVVGSSTEEMIEHGYTAIEAASFPVFLDVAGDEYALARTETKTGNGYHGFDCVYNKDVTLKDDLFRRDLTINSMAVPVDDWVEFRHSKSLDLVVDPYNGHDDLFSGTIKHTSEFFTDDPVRALRAVRLANRYQFAIHIDTIFLIRDMVKSGELDHLTPERIWLEVKKVFKGSKNIGQFFYMCDELGITEKIFPNTDELFIDDEDLLKFTESGSDNMEYAFLAMMNVNSVEYVEHFCEVLKIPNSYLKLFKAHNKVEFFFNDDIGVDFSVDIVNLLESLNAFQCPLMLEKTCHYMNKIEGLFVDETEKLFDALRKTTDIGFGDLDEAEKEKLKGHKIAEAISNRRIMELME